MQDIQTKNRGILFNSDMVKALLAGIKTQTRRTSGLDEVNIAPDNWELKNLYQCPDTRRMFAFIQHKYKQDFKLIACPYGAPADQLWVRETLYYDVCGSEFCYQADNSPVQAELSKYKRKVIPSIHMPKDASRLNLSVTDIRLERLNDVTEVDAIAEGIGIFGASHESFKIPAAKNVANISYRTYDPATAFKSYVRIINKLAYDFNPWVWVVNFEVLNS